MAPLARLLNGLLSAALFGAAALAADAPRLGEQSGLPLPRFVSIAGDKANLRVGPSTRYPIDWVYQRQNLPVEVIGEFGLWRRIRDIDGIEGWAHKSVLSGRRHALVTGETRALRKAPRDDAAVVLRAEPMVIGRLLACRIDWCLLRIDGDRGWLRRSQLWGVHAGEVFGE